AQEQSAQKSNKGGWHSEENLFKSKHPSVQWLVRNLFIASARSVKDSDYFPDKQEIVMSGCWVNINESGDWNAPHSHLPDIWSGVCYIDVNSKTSADMKSDKDGDIVFFNPLPLWVEHNRPVVTYARPENGKVYLFPSYLLHMVAPHYDDKPRISVAFNMKFKPADT
ncbi:MAG: hypothetical protein ACI9NT_002525, partial [Bacteroidia bacterium]